VCASRKQKNKKNGHKTPKPYQGLIGKRFAKEGGGPLIWGGEWKGGGTEARAFAKKKKTGSPEKPEQLGPWSVKRRAKRCLPWPLWWGGCWKGVKKGGGRVCTGKNGGERKVVWLRPSWGGQVSGPEDNWRCKPARPASLHMSKTNECGYQGEKEKRQGFVMYFLGRLLQSYKKP